MVLCIVTSAHVECKGMCMGVIRDPAKLYKWKQVEYTERTNNIAKSNFEFLLYNNY